MTYIGAAMQGKRFHLRLRGDVGYKHDVRLTT